MPDEVVEPIMLTCPYCKHEFDFISIAGNKNMWGVFEEYLIVQCPKCADGFKIDMGGDKDVRKSIGIRETENDG